MKATRLMSAVLALAGVLAAACGVNVAPGPQSACQQATHVRPTPTPSGSGYLFRNPPLYIASEAVPLGLSAQVMQVTSIECRDGNLLIDFQIDNQGGWPMDFRGEDDIEVRTVDGRALEFVPSLSNPLPVSIPAKSKAQGKLAFKITDSTRGFKLYYDELSHFHDVVPEAIIALDQATAQNPFPTPPEVAKAKPFAADTVFHAGDSVNFDGVTVGVRVVRIADDHLLTEIMVHNGRDKAIVVEGAAWELRDNTGAAVQRDTPYRNTPRGTLFAGDTLRGTMGWIINPKATSFTASYGFIPYPDFYGFERQKADTFRWAITR